MELANTSNGRGLALWLLGATVVATTAGMAASTFRGDGTAINAFLFLSCGLSHTAAARIEQVAMTIVLLLSLVAFVRPRWTSLSFVFAYILAEAIARWHERGYGFAEWAVTAQAPRYLTPLAVIFLAFGIGRSDAAGRWWRLAGDGVLRLGLCVVFAVHGLEALRVHPEFVDLIISTAANLFDIRITERAATVMLQGIGVLDVMVAAAILFRPRPAVLWWAAFWGAITAFSRVTAYGSGGYPEVLVRTAHFTGPIALWLLARARAAEKASPVPPMEQPSVATHVEGTVASP